MNEKIQNSERSGERKADGGVLRAVLAGVQPAVDDAVRAAGQVPVRSCALIQPYADRLDVLHLDADGRIRGVYPAPTHRALKSAIEVFVSHGMGLLPADGARMATTMLEKGAVVLVIRVDIEAGIASLLLTAAGADDAARTSTEAVVLCSLSGAPEIQH